MFSKYDYYSSLAEETAGGLTKSREQWTAFLRTAGRVNKYSYGDQLMIFAQRPEATACAEYDLWNQTMRRYVKRGSRGIALLDNSGDRPRLRYVFDVSDTGTRANSRPVNLWQMREEYRRPVQEALKGAFDVSARDPLEIQVENIASWLAIDYWQDHEGELADIVAGSFLEEYDEDNRRMSFLNAATVSIRYEILSRCVENPDDYFEADEFAPVLDYNTCKAINALGTAVSEMSGQVFREIERTIRNYERSKDTERSRDDGADLHEERRLPDPEPHPEGERREAAGEIRPDAPDISAGTPSNSLQRTVPDGAAVSPSEGNRRDGTPESRAADGGASGEEPHPGQTDAADGLGTAHEQPESTGGGDRAGGAGVQLTGEETEPVYEQMTLRFPTEAEQIAEIDQEAESENLSAFSIPQEEIDQVLRLGGRNENSRMEVAAQFMTGKSTEDIADFLRWGYRGGLGLLTDNGRLSAWFDDRGLWLARGDRARDAVPGMYIPWQMAAERIGELLDAGRFATNVELAEAQGLYRTQLAQAIWYLRHDFAENAEGVSLLPSLDRYRGGGYPKETEQLAKALAEPEYLAALTQDMESFSQVYAQERGVLRFHHHNLPAILDGLRNLAEPWKEYTSDMAEVPQAGQFITEDEIDEAVAYGSSMSGGKRRIYTFFSEPHTTREQADFLREEYGIGGHSGAFPNKTHSFEDHDSKGIRLQKDGCVSVTLTWNAVAKRVAALIKADRYLTAEEAEQAEQSPQQTTVTEEPVAFYPGEQNGLPFDVEIRTLHFGEPEQEATEEALYADYKEQTHRNAQNFRITDDALGEGGSKAKCQANVAAIRLLQHLEAEGLQASPEQQEVLSRYVGWGSLADAFDPNKPAWAQEYQELKSLLTEDEYAAARASTLNAHYTSPTVIKAIYEAVGNMGFQTGNILEPSMGVGNFFGLLPDSMAGSKLYGVELDSITGRIAQQLYPYADIRVAGFETTDRRDFYDLAVGNVPFGDYKVNDRPYNKLGFSIHNYFFAKALDQVRPGGVVAFVTSRYTMDAKSPEVRKYLAQRAELLGAIRLPNNAFRANAGTDVVSDIIFLQKRETPIDIEPDWVHLGQTPGGIAINSYFTEHPEMILGELTSQSTQYGREECTVIPLPDADLAEQLKEAVTHIHGSYQPMEISAEESPLSGTETLPASPDVKNFSFAAVDGEVYYREGSVMRHVALSETARQRALGMISLRQTVNELIAYQLEDYPEEEIRAKQQELENAYDSFTEKYGLLNSRPNARVFGDDSSYYLLCSLEDVDEDGKLIGKADMFTKRTIRPDRSVTSVDTPVEALAVSIGEQGRVDLPFMSQLLGTPGEYDRIIEELSGVIFRDPLEASAEDVTKGWHTADDYLSGNVRVKLQAAKLAAKTDPGYAVNVSALEKAQPKDLEASEIDVRLGATWIEKEYIQQFMQETFETPFYMRRSIEVKFSPLTAEWQITGKTIPNRHDVAAYVTYGTDRANAYRILEETLNLKDIRIYDTVEDVDGKQKRVLNKKETTLAQQKQQAIKDAFQDWIWKDPERRETLCRTYNELFNSIRPREYDGSHIHFVGMNPEITLREHQKNAIAHVLYGGNTLLAHEVGAGKTFEMAAAAMESKRLGLCQKSLFVVPNHLTTQWANEFLRLYPSAKILVATRKDFETARRKKFCARIATGDYDAVIIGHSQFEKIPVSAERQERQLREQIEDIEKAISSMKYQRGESFTIKQMEKTRRSLQTKLDKLTSTERKDDVVTFEQLGVDRIFVDECQYVKNLFLYTKMRNVAGLSTSEAQRSSDMYIEPPGRKCRTCSLSGKRSRVFWRLIVSKKRGEE